MKKMLDKKVWSHVHCVAKSILMLLIAVALVYSFLYMPFMNKQVRAACHATTLTEANSWGQTILEQNQDNEEISRAELEQQINTLIAQRYETNHVLCQRANGL